MSLAADDHQNGASGRPRTGSAASPVAVDEDSGSSPTQQDRPANENGSSVSAKRRGKLDENLFSDDPRKQYVAIKELETSATISRARYDRIHNIRWSTRHLALAELAERVLEKRRPASPVPTATHQEIMSLVRQCERQQRQRLFQALQEDPEVALPRGALTRWLIGAAVAGFVLGGVMTYLLVPRGKHTETKAAEAYIDARTGDVTSAEPDAQGRQAGPAGIGDYEPAYYCWKCRKWLPVKNPQKQAAPVAGPLQALSDRPLAPRPKTR